jgi:hypothetical protein
MKNKIIVSRRNFLKKTSVGLGAGLIGTSALSCSQSFTESKNKLSREVCLASVDLKGGIIQYDLGILFRAQGAMQG